MSGIYTAAAAVVVGGISAISASNNADKAAGAQRDAASQASNTQLSMYNQTRSDEAPWVTTGSQANQALAQFYGLPGMSSGGSPGTQGSPGMVGNGPSGPGGKVGGVPDWTSITANPNLKATAGQGMPAGQQAQPGQPATASGAPDYQKILSSLPGYQFQLQQGQLATEHNLAARGLLGSGAAQKALDTYGQGVAQNYAGQYTQGLQNLSQMGQAGAAGVATAGMNAANQIGSNSIYAGNATAAGYANQSNAMNQGLSGLVGAYGAYNQYQGNQNAMYGPAYTGPTTGYAAAGGTTGGYNDFLNTVYSP